MIKIATPMTLRTEAQTCVYCGKPAPFFAPIPKHVKCPECCTHPPGHVIAVQQPVCADCHPEKEHMKMELRYQEEEAEREKVWAAREMMLLEIFSNGNAPEGAAVVVTDKYGRDIAAKAWGELQSELVPMVRIEK